MNKTAWGMLAEIACYACVGMAIGAAIGGNLRGAFVLLYMAFLIYTATQIQLGVDLIRDLHFEFFGVQCPPEGVTAPDETDDPCKTMIDPPAPAEDDKGVAVKVER